MITLRPYQKEGIDQIAMLYSSGTRNIVYQLATGGGKTICFCGLTDRFRKAMDRSVLIAVHREELLTQTRKSLYNHFAINSEAIISGRKNVPYSGVYVAMVETLYNLLKRKPHFADHIGMLIIDECHLANFKKLFDYFPNVLRVGFSATPISSSKKHPMRDYYDDIITGPSIDDLIMSGSLCPNETYSIKGINRKSFGIKRGEFDNKQMGATYSNIRHVQNTVEAYKRLGEGQKTMVFNCNVEHSKLVNDAFLASGFDSKHLDGTENKIKRREVLTWLKNTPNAILNNVGVLTTGFDEPTIKNIIINRSTMSLPLWMQMTGRGSRPSTDKEYFRIIDMGGNALTHGDWRAMRNWDIYFHHPDKPTDAMGAAPIKECSKCEAIIPAQSIFCGFCGHEHPRVINYDTILPDFELLVGRINVEVLVEQAKDSGHKEFKVFFDILNKSVTILKYRLNGMELTDGFIDQTLKTFEDRIKEWRHAIGKPYDRYTREFAQKKFREECEKLKSLNIAS